MRGSIAVNGGGGKGERRGKRGEREREKGGRGGVTDYHFSTAIRKQIVQFSCSHYK